jgi:hypothetical protein
LITEEQLNRFRLSGEKVRVQRDQLPENDVRGVIVAWDEKYAVLRKPNRNLVKVPRYYIFTSAKEPRVTVESQGGSDNDLSKPTQGSD